VERTRSYRLPDGKATEDPDVYADAWIGLGKRVEVLFPGYMATGFGPDISFKLVEEYKDCQGESKHRCIDRFSLTIKAINTLLSTTDG